MGGQTPHKYLCEERKTLSQTCSRPKPRAQYAFKDSMIHGILQFTLSIAFRCVLHRGKSQDIHCWELWYLGERGLPSLSVNWFRLMVRHRPIQHGHSRAQVAWAGGLHLRATSDPIAPCFDTKHDRKEANLQGWVQVRFAVVCLWTQWSFRRFTYGNLVTTSPSSRWEGLMNFSSASTVASQGSRSEHFTSTPNR